MLQPVSLVNWTCHFLFSRSIDVFDSTVTYSFLDNGFIFLKFVMVKSFLQFLHDHHLPDVLYMC